MKKGIHQWMFPPEMAIEDCMRLATKAGFDGIELMIHPEPRRGLPLETPEKRLNELKNFAQELGLALKTMSYKYTCWLTSAEPEKRAKAVETISRSLELASKLGVETLLVIVGGVEVSIFDTVEPLVSYDEAYLRAQAGLKELGPVAEKCGVHIGVENVPTKFLLSPLEFVRFLDEIHHPYVGSYFDVANAQLFGYPAQWIRILGHRIKKVHVKDFKLRIGTLNGYCPLLEGDIDWLEVMKAFREVGYDDYITTEVLPPFKYFPEQLIYSTAKSLATILQSSPHGQ